jgi:hypothetical protein
MSPHLHAELMHARTAEIARNAARHHEAPRRERSPRQPRSPRVQRLFAVLRPSRAVS